MDNFPWDILRIHCGELASLYGGREHGLLGAARLIHETTSRWPPKAQRELPNFRPQKGSG